MKILLDENLPHRRRPLITGHDVETVTYRGWNSKTNGELLQLAADAGFEAMQTNDTKLPYQQNQADLPLAVVVLAAPRNDLEDLRPLVPKLLAALENLPPERVTIIG